MIDKSDYVEFLGCLDNITRVSGISFRKNLDGEEINTEEALFVNTLRNFHILKFIIKKQSNFGKQKIKIKVNRLKNL